MARQVGVPRMVVYLNKVDQLDDEELLELVELEVRELLSDQGFDGDDCPVIRGAALARVGVGVDGRERAGVRDDSGVDGGGGRVRADAGAADGGHAVPDAGRGRVRDQGAGHGGDGADRARGGELAARTIEIVGLKDTRSTVVTGVEMFKKTLPTGEAGDNVGCLLRGIDREEIARVVRCWRRRARITPHTAFEAEVYILGKDEGGRHTSVLPLGTGRSSTSGRRT